MNLSEENKLIMKKAVFFKGLTDDDLDLMTQLSTSACFSKNQLLVEEGDEADEFFLVREGRLGIEASSRDFVPVRFQELGVGEVCGWSWLMPPYRWSFDVRAVVDTVVLVIDGKLLRKICEQRPSLGYLLLKKLSRLVLMRLQEANQLLLERHRRDVDSKNVSSY